MQQHALGPHQDTPGKIFVESSQINLKFTRTDGDPNSGTICWNLPSNYDDASWSPEEYNGMLLLLSNKPIKVSPKDNTYYEFDNTANPDLHMGDKIDDVLVIGAFYNDLRTEHKITGLSEKTPVYIAGFACDNVARYGTISASYSLPLGADNQTKDTQGYQSVKLGVLESDNPKLTKQHKLKLYIDDTDYVISIDPKETYKELIDNINEQLAKLSNNTHSSEIPPNKFSYQVSNKLSQFDGSKLNELECHFLSTEPSIKNGTYWFNNNLKIYENGWNDVFVFEYKKPADEIDCSDLWFDGKSIYTWMETWKKQKTYISESDPNIKKLKCNTFWHDGIKFFHYIGGCNNPWEQLVVYESDNDPTTYLNGYYWFNEGVLYQLIDKSWNKLNVEISETPLDRHWYNETTNKLYQKDNIELDVNVITFPFDVTIPTDWYWYNGELNKWDELNQRWSTVKNLITGPNPAISNIKTNDYWVSDIVQQWDGTQWNVRENIIRTNKQPNSNDIYYNGVDYYKDGVKLDVLTYSYDPSILNSGQYWFNTDANQLYIWNGLNWVSLLYSNQASPNIGDHWYNGKLYVWNGSWVETKPKAYVELVNGDLKFYSSTYGSKSKLFLADQVDNEQQIFNHTRPVGQFQRPQIGVDHLSEIPMYKQLGVGTDGSQDERRDLINKLLMQLGYPAIQVELAKEQLNLCVDLAIQSLRKLSSAPYERSIFFMDLIPNVQNYFLTDGTVGLNKIVDINAIYRRNSSYLSSSYGNSMYAQVLLQWLYQPGAKMDLVSYHAVSEYIEMLETMFATKIVFRFTERSRKLDIYQTIGLDETVIVDCVIERTEQDLITDRYTGKWINNWALGEACVMLSQIRGKYSSVPGAGGGVSLNAGDMQSRADELFTKCREEVDNYIVNNPEKIGLESGILLG